MNILKITFLTGNSTDEFVQPKEPGIYYYYPSELPVKLQENIGIKLLQNYQSNIVPVNQQMTFNLMPDTFSNESWPYWYSPSFRDYLRSCGVNPLTVEYSRIVSKGQKFIAKDGSIQDFIVSNGSCSIQNSELLQSIFDIPQIFKPVERTKEIPDTKFPCTPSINDIASIQWHWVEKQGWHNKSNLEQLALIASEVGEAVNECRGDKPTEKYASELADILLRTLDAMVSNGYNVEQELLAKIDANSKRGTIGRKY